MARTLLGTLIAFSSGTLLQDPANVSVILPFGAFAFYTARVGEAGPPVGAKKFLKTIKPAASFPALDDRDP